METIKEVDILVVGGGAAGVAAAVAAAEQGLPANTRATSLCLPGAQRCRFARKHDAARAAA